MRYFLLEIPEVCVQTRRNSLQEINFQANAKQCKRNELEKSVLNAHS